MSKNSDITILSAPVEADILDWLFSHPDCDSIIESERGSSNIRVFAFSNSAEGNRELRKYRRENLSNKNLLVGMAKDGIASVI